MVLFRESGSQRRPMSRRDFLHATAAGLVPVALGACVSESTGIQGGVSARLQVQPGPPTREPAPGANRLGLGFSRGAVLYIPDGYDHETPTPLLVTLHGRPGDAQTWEPFYPKCDLRGIVMLAVESRGLTWDLVATGGYGPDVEFIDLALAAIFEQVNVDADAMALAGFSDGASYALSLGLSNGDLFSRLIAFSPGFYEPGRQVVGKPLIWISHGREDDVFDEAYTEDQIVQELRRSDYVVEYTPFDGGHEVPAEISNAALDWYV